ncbi:MAG: glycoside hydrolase family 2 [Chthonomonadaceae bacterium]|nr:glycoside hydrolase family 2 [Chthonomonadaceae bacterium]
MISTNNLPRVVVRLSGILLMMTPLTIAHSQERLHFARQFAPQDGLVAPAEKPYRSEICLNGSWQFQPVRLPVGFQRGTGKAPELSPPAGDAWEKTPIRIPSPWNANSFADHDGLAGDFRCFPSYPAAWNGVQMGWLRRQFTVPNTWKGRRLILHFEAVAGAAQIIVNGKPVGEHFDIFLPFDVDITDAVKMGAANELLVGVRKASLFDSQGRFGRRTYQGGSMWGQHIVGIWQDVTLTAVPMVHITDVFVKPQLDQDRLSAEVTVRNDTDRAAKVRLGSAAFPWISETGTDVQSAPEPKWHLGKAAAFSAPAVSADIPAHSSATVTLSGKVGGRLKFWSPESPALYGLVCRLKGSEPSLSDARYMRFGWRQVTFQGSQVILNGKPIVMKGDSWHFIGIPEMTRRYAWAWYRAMKDAHLNAVRLHAEPYPPFFMDVADEQGILVLDESAMWASDGGPKLDAPAYWSDTEAHLQGLILRDRNHPSVFGWSVSNEIEPVIANVFHGPKEMQDELVRYDAIWDQICRKYDPTRLWISADGESDARGTLPTFVIHYGDVSTMRRAVASGKPWGVGEAGPAYYGTPQEIVRMSGNQRAYLSAFDRMEGVAKVSYDSLMDQRQYNAAYRSVFNLVWYALKPLNLGMTDTTRPPVLTDGVFFPPFVEGKPGVQPERLGPYCTTLNPGYDPRLPLYSTWPLFDAIQDAQAEPPLAYKPQHSFTLDVGPALDPARGTIKSAPILASSEGVLGRALADAGVPLAPPLSPDLSLVFVDGAHPPVETEAKQILQHTLDAGGTVFVWGANASTLAQLNLLLPYRLELTDRTASSLVVATPDSLTAGLTPASLYFSELSPATVLSSGLGGPLVEKSKVLLAACDTDWRRWNRQEEMTKTVMLLRSETESKPSGAALIAYSSGKGRLLVCSLPIVPLTSQAATLNRVLLGNLGLALGAGAATRNALDESGMITRTLAYGNFRVASVEEGLAASHVAPNSGPKIMAGAVLDDRPWTSVTAGATGALDLRSLRDAGSRQAGLSYLSFWLYSPKSLDNLLLDPHLPKLSLTVSAATVQVWLNARAVPTEAQEGRSRVPTLLLQQGWNHLLVKVVRPAGDRTLGPILKLESSQADYLMQLRGAQEKP